MPSLATPAEEAPGAIPKYFQHIIEKANVSFEFYDLRQQTGRHLGYTTFQLKIDHQFRFRYEWVERNGGWQVTIRPRLEDLTSEVKNRVRLPDYLQTRVRWESRLVRHEFDHVAMTVDPRVQMLFRHICRHLGVIVRQVDRETKIDQQWVRQVILGELTPRRKAVHDLLLDNQDYLDEITHHGEKRLADHEAFFRSLFTEENLRQQRFPYLDEVRDLLRQKGYREAELPYRTDS